MKYVFILSASIFLLHYAHAQDQTVQQLKSDASKTIKKDPNDTVSKVWKTGGLLTLNIAQGSLSNWVGGGDKFSLSAVAYLNLYAYYKKDKNAWDNSLDLGYGIVNTTSLGRRKSDDRIDLLSKYGYQVSKKWYASALFNLRTQFANGYSYSKDNLGNDVKTLTSASFAPAYVLLSLGMNYKPVDYFSVFISPLTQRWTIVSNSQLSALGAYGVKPGEKSRSEIGAFLTANFNKEVAKNIIYTSRLDLFSNYKSEPQNVDLYFTNILAMKVNKIISANINVDLVYDDNAIARLQVRQLLGVGLSAKF
ncbi:MAG TPA: DUF3078 domain-containing protein [Chitinophagaceae bacterium]|jgi:hypothetical protein|nr:DUF3078 domain-containing protein [Chitinophagaceae bacterium]